MKDIVNSGKGQGEVNCLACPLPLAPMTIGVLQLELSVPDAMSLKDKPGDIEHQGPDRPPP